MLKLPTYAHAANLSCGPDKLLKQILRATQGQQLQWRLKSAVITATTTGESMEPMSDEWLRAKPFSAMPKMSVLTQLKNFLLPGGKYTKLDSTQLLLAFREDLGPIALVPGLFGKPDFVFTHNPQDFEKVLRNEGIWPNRPGSESIHYHRNVRRRDFFQGVDGLLGAQGESWGSFRSIVNPVMMQPKNIRLYFKKLSQVNLEFMQRIREIRDPLTLEMPRNFEEEINRWALESVAIVALDKQLGLLTKNRNDPIANDLNNALKGFLTHSPDVELKPSIWKYYKTPAFQDLMMSLDQMVDIASRYVDEALQRLENERRRGEPEKPANELSVLEKLLKIDRRVAIVMAMEMLMAGVDTTTLTLTGLLLCLSKNPQKQMKLREEVRKLLPHKDSEFDENVFKNMPYLRACIKESLRLYPLLGGNARMTVNDVVLSGYQVPKGTLVGMLSVTFKDDETHYPRAKEYLPERWLRPEKNQESAAAGQCPNSLKPSSPFVFLPFGFGSRSCIGRRLAEMEMELGVARLIRNFHIEYNYPMENAFKSLLINVPNIPLTFKFTDVEK